MQTTVADDLGPGSTYLWPRSFFDFLDIIPSFPINALN